MSDPDYMPDLSTVNKTKSTNTLTVFQYMTNNRKLYVHYNLTKLDIVHESNNDKELVRYIDG